MQVMLPFFFGNSTGYLNTAQNALFWGILPLKSTADEGFRQKIYVKSGKALRNIF